MIKKINLQTTVEVMFMTLNKLTLITKDCRKTILDSCKLIDDHTDEFNIDSIEVEPDFKKKKLNISFLCDKIYASNIDNWFTDIAKSSYNIKFEKYKSRLKTKLAYNLI